MISEKYNNDNNNTTTELQLFTWSQQQYLQPQHTGLLVDWLKQRQAHGNRSKLRNDDGNATTSLVTAAVETTVVSLM